MQLITKFTLATLVGLSYRAFFGLLFLFHIYLPVSCRGAGGVVTLRLLLRLLRRLLLRLLLLWRRAVGLLLLLLLWRRLGLLLQLAGFFFVCVLGYMFELRLTTLYDLATLLRTTIY